MHQQLIVTILGDDNVGNLSRIAATVCEAGCSILDSRQAIYGQDFSLTMILQGSQSAISKAEFMLPQLCQQLNLLSMMKRTKKHAKQNLQHLADASFSGKDAVGVMSQVSAFFARQQIAINAFRQDTFNQQEIEMMQCKMVISLPQRAEIDDINQQFQTLMQQLHMQGSIQAKD